MSIYDITFNTQGENLLPPKKRKPKILALLFSFLKPLQWIRDIIFNNYGKGEYSEIYNSANTYPKETVVQWVDYRLYSAIQDVPISTPCNNVLYWKLVVTNNVGLIQRAGATGQLLSLEFILNKHFNTTFRQPITGLNSDIYVASFPVDTTYFVSGIDGSSSSNAAISGADATEFVGESYTYEIESLLIFVPNTVLNAISLGTESSPYPNAQKTVLLYANKLIYAGIIAKVVGY